MNARFVTAPVLAIVLIAGIGGAPLEAQRPAARKPATHTVTIDGSQFSPATLTVKTGDTVIWVNKDILAHTATSASGGFDSTTIQPGKSWKYVAKTKGEFAYICSFHPMNGKLIVR